MVCGTSLALRFTELNLISRKFSVYWGGKHHLVEQELHEKYGSVIRDGPNSLLFSSLAAFDAIYGFNRFLEKGAFYDFARESNSEALKIFGSSKPRSRPGSVFSAPTDAIHREHRRKVLGPAFSINKITAYEPVIAKHVAILLSRLEEEQAKFNGSASINIALYIHRYTFDTLIEIIYGKSISDLPYTETPASRDLLPAIRTIATVAWGTSLLPWFSWLMSTRPMLALSRRPTYDKEGNLVSFAALICRVRNIVLTHPEVVSDTIQPSILENFLQVPKDDTKRMSRDEIGRECVNLTMAASTSTAAGLTATLYELGRRGHEWQERIRSDPHKQPPTTTTAATTPTSSSNLQAVLKESIRLHAPFPTGFPRSIALGGETTIPNLPAPLPIGTTVSANPYILGRSKEIWGGDAEQWRPERWLAHDANDAEEKKTTTATKLEDKFVAFSKGARGCLGKELAMLVLGKAVAAVVERWEVGVEGELRGKGFLEMQYEEVWVKLERRGEKV